MIEKRDFERMMNQARVKLPGSSDAGIKGELFDTIDEFVSDSNCWNEWITVLVVPVVQDYHILPLEGGMIFRLVAVFDPNHINMPSLLPHLHPPGATLHLVWPQNMSITAKAYVIKKVVMPTVRDDLPDAPSWLLQVYERQIQDGLLGRMMTQINKSYSNATQGAYHLKRFRDGIAVAKTAAMRSNLFGGQAWRFPHTARISTQRGGMSTLFPEPTAW